MLTALFICQYSSNARVSCLYFLYSLVVLSATRIESGTPSSLRTFRYLKAVESEKGSANPSRNSGVSGAHVNERAATLARGSTRINTNRITRQANTRPYLQNIELSIRGIVPQVCRLMYGFFGFFANSVIFCPPVYGSAAHNFHDQRRNRRLGMVGNNL